MAKQEKLGLGWRIHDAICPIWRFQLKAAMKAMACCWLRLRAERRRTA